VLVKYRYESAALLYFAPCIEQLIDSNYCRNLTLLLHVKDLEWERYLATPTLGDALPREKGIYMFVWRPDFSMKFENNIEERLTWILYVGKAGIEGGTNDTLKDRYKSEYSKYVGKDAGCLWEKTDVSARRDRLKRYLTLRPLEYWCLPLENTGDILLYETKLLTLLRPPLNTQHSTYITPGKPEPLLPPQGVIDGQ